MTPATALFLVERGWRGARHTSLAMPPERVRCVCLIKGRLPSSFRQVIRPYAHITLRSVPRMLFRPAAWWLLASSALGGRLRLVFCDHERTLKEISGLCRAARATPILIEEQPTAVAWTRGRQRLEWRQVVELLE